jgi:hypothetical protein
MKVLLLPAAVLALFTALLALGGGSAPVRAGPDETDTDGDGCTDAQEQGTNPLAGGQRNPNSFWDFFDTPDSSNVRDRSIVVSDIFRISQRLGTSGTATSVANALSTPPTSGYHAAFDRSAPSPGAGLWASGPADGAVSVGDISYAVAQFGHSCSGTAPAPTPTPTPAPSGSWVITFNDLTGQQRTLNGQHPPAVADWGTAGWWLAGPWGAFTTKSIGFNGPGMTSGTFTLLTPRRVYSIDAFNGGEDTTVTLACPGQTTRQVTLTAGQLATISTNWTGTCTSVTITSTNGWDTNFDNIVLQGPAPPPTPTPTPLPPIPTPTPGVTLWAFQETFDGAPTVPQPFSSPRWDVVVGNNDADGIVDGQVVSHVDDSITYGTIEAGHTSMCGAPFAQPGDANNHNINVDSSLLGFQQNTRPQLAYVCSNHLMTAVKAGYAVVSLMPRQLFDWQGRVGTVEMETSLFTFGREWWDTYIVPEDEMLLEVVDELEGGTGEQLPRRAVKFSFVGNKLRVAVIDEYHIIEEHTVPQMWREMFPDDPALTDPRIRRVVRMQVSQQTWKMEIQKEDGQYFTFSGNFGLPLSFTRGLVRFEHHAYNPTKDYIFGEPWSQFTYHWDNMRFDGPVLPAHTAFEAPPHFVDLVHDPDPNNIKSVQINVTTSNIQHPVLVGHIHSEMQNDNMDPLNTSHWRQFRINGGPWQDINLVKTAPSEGPGGGNRSWSTFRNSLTGVVQGINTIDFRYPVRPPMATWQRNGFRVKELEIQVDPIGPTALAQPGAPSSASQALLSAYICDTGAPLSARSGGGALNAVLDRVRQVVAQSERPGAF